MSERTETTPILSAFLVKTRETFQQRYKETDMPSVLLAQIMLEEYVEQGVMEEKDALKILGDGGAFADFLLKAEQLYQQREDQRVHDRMTSLERNTDWKVAAVVSIGAGMVTGIVFALASPFITTWLQPTADALFKRQPATQSPVTPPQSSITNTYNFNTTVINPAPAQPSPAPEDENKPKTRLTCKNVTSNAYQSSMLELLQRGDVVTLEMNGKKLSLCYRPGNQSKPQQKALAQ